MPLRAMSYLTPGHPRLSLCEHHFHNAGPVTFSPRPKAMHLPTLDNSSTLSMLSVTCILSQRCKVVNTVVL